MEVRRGQPGRARMRDGVMMSDEAKKVLLSVADFLERLTGSANLHPEQVTEAHMSLTSLKYQLAQAECDPAFASHIDVEEQRLCEELKPLLPAGAGSGSTSNDRLWQASWCSGVGARATEFVESRKIPSDPEDVLKAAGALKRFLIEYHQKADPAIAEGSKVAYQGGRGDLVGEAEEAYVITKGKLEKYLTAKGRYSGDVTVTEIKQLTGGFSKETYFVSVHDTGNGEDSRFVIRKDIIGLPTSTTVVDEFKVLQQAREMGIPAPVPMWLEADESMFTTACMAVEFNTGKPAHLNLPDDDQGKRLWTAKAAQLVATLHKQTVRTDKDASDCLNEEIAHFEKCIRERERVPHPGMAFSLAWLRERAQDLEGRPVCRTHGDVGFHNMLVDGDEITALLDWEFSHFSDPMEDLQYTRPFMEKLGTWDYFLSTYREISGFDYEPSIAGVFSVRAEIRNFILCIGCLNSLLIPRVRDVGLSLAGTTFIPKFEISSLDGIIDNLSKADNLVMCDN